MTSFDKARRIRLMILVALVVAFAATPEAHAALAQLGPFSGPRPFAMGGIAGWVLARQAMFYRELAGTIRLAGNNGSALWALMGISFVYGIFHAAGPGHGKAVISSYLVANEETWRRGVTLSFAAAVMQSLTAIAIVAVAAVLLGATAKLMGDTVRVIETVSYSLIVVLGARLLWVKGHGFFRALRAARTERVSLVPAIEPHEHNAACAGDHGHDDHHHRHDHQDHAQAPLLAPGSDADSAPVAIEAPAHCQDHDDHHHDDAMEVLPWGHAHGPEPQQLAGPNGWRRGLSAVVAVGLRPCSGAIIVLVFALAQGLFWAGIASTFIMGLGTAITVGIVATLAVGAKTLAKRMARRPSGYGTVFMRGLEFGAAGLVFSFGVLLLTGYMASERMGLF